LVHIGPNEEESELFKIIDMRENLKIALKERENESI
jgi:hypothetical protein